MRCARTWRRRAPFGRLLLGSAKEGKRAGKVGGAEVEGAGRRKREAAAERYTGEPRVRGALAAPRPLCARGEAEQKARALARVAARGERAKERCVRCTLSELPAVH